MNRLAKLPLYLMMGFAGIFSFSACSDDDNKVSSTDGLISDNELQTIVQQYVDATVNPTYKLLAAETESLANRLADLRDKVKNGTVTDAEIKNVCDIFLRARSYYETSEAFLFGAASDYGIDPHIDSWPLDVDELKTQLSNTLLFAKMEADETGMYANSLATTLLGFHGIEYVLFRDGEPRTAEALKGNDPDLNNLSGYNEIVYATSVARDLRNSCFHMECAWNAQAPQSHIDIVENVCEWSASVVDQDYTYTDKMLNVNKPGYGFASWKEAISEILVAGCINISDEVGNTKLGKPVSGDDVNYIESPYSHKSLDDFTDNIVSIENSYMGGREELRDESKSLHALMQKYNPTLDTRMLNAIQNAKAKIQAIPHPFVSYIQEQTDRTAGQAAIEACNELSNVTQDINNYILAN